MKKYVPPAELPEWVTDITILYRGGKNSAYMTSKPLCCGDKMIEKHIIAEKLRLTATELGQAALDGAIIVGPHNLESVSNHTYVHCPTLGETTLGHVDWQVARFFEDVEVEGE